MSTPSAKAEAIQRKWFVVDLQDKVLGRAATRIATILRGKHKVLFTPHADTGDFIVVINAEKVKLTGNKWDKKLYRHHSNFPGGMKEFTAKKLVQRHPEDLITRAVGRMLPRTALGRQMMTKLKVYAGDKHPHEAQKPEPLAL